MTKLEATSNKEKEEAKLWIGYEAEHLMKSMSGMNKNCNFISKYLYTLTKILSIDHMESTFLVTHFSVNENCIKKEEFTNLEEALIRYDELYKEEEDD